MLADAEITALHRRWREILVGVHAGLGLAGIDDRDVYATGHPLRLQIGSYAEVLLAEAPGQPRALIRCQKPGKGVLVAGLDATDAEVVADILDCLAVLHWRRQRRLDAERAAVEAELAEMVTGAGWECAGVGGTQPTAAFRSTDDRVRGRLVRADRGDGDPSRATFSISAEVGGLGYAQTLRALADLRRGLTPAIAEEVAPRPDVQVPVLM